jgi:prolyl oligopeptidase
MMLRRTVTVLTAFLLAATAVLAADAQDPFAWLEEIDGQKALEWAKAQSARTTKELEAVKAFKPIYDRTLQIMDSKDRIPRPSLYGTTVYNFWQDDVHQRGIWRRTSLASYRRAEPEWETVIDIDAMSKADGVPWVFKGATCLPPAYEDCMVALSRGGGDAVTYLEFDAATKSFVDSGFSLPEAKSRVAWHDKDALWLGTDFGEGSLTTSGYPRIVKLWKRGTSVSEARTVFEGQAGDVASAGYTVFTPDRRYDIVSRTPAFFRSELYLALDGRLVHLDIPEDAELSEMFKDHMLITLRSDWTVGGKTYPAGALLATALDDFLQGKRSFDVLFEPSDRTSLGRVASTRDRVVMSVLDNVHGKLYSLTLGDGGWNKEELPLPGIGTVGIGSTSNEADLFFYTYQDFLTPSSLYLDDAGTVAKVKFSPAFFDPSGMKVEQYEATSEDGTKIPYFVVTPKGFVADGKAPTLLYGYGGFEISELPTYNATIGASWLERGGVYALANIRGGGEFGPRWHQAAMKHDHIRNFQDFAAVARDLIARSITSQRYLGIMGGSQGGLLVSGTMVLYPDLFHAVVAQVPLTDMKRFTHLLAGASWMAEYGDPDNPEDWAFMQKWSPYQNVRKDVKYPTPFYWTNTRDDRVHPGHARKMVAKLEATGHPVYYFENVEGGHGSGSVNAERAYVSALQYAYLWKMLR